MNAIVVTDEAAGTAGMTLAERPDPQPAINDPRARTGRRGDRAGLWLGQPERATQGERRSSVLARKEPDQDRDDALAPDLRAVRDGAQDDVQHAGGLSVGVRTSARSCLVERPRGASGVWLVTATPIDGRQRKSGIMVRRYGRVGARTMGEIPRSTGRASTSADRRTASTASQQPTFFGSASGEESS
jgi:hypothetical protein